MDASMTKGQMKPVLSEERIGALDAARGAALLGVLMINLQSDFRASLFTQILNFHTSPGWADRAVDVLNAWVFEFKAFTLFSFLFGVGVGVQTERLAARGMNPSRFFVRRFTALLAIGLFHMFLIWNGDILTLYAVCGLLLIPFLKVSARGLALAGSALIVVSPFLPFFGDFFPTEAAMRAQAELATRVYATGSFREIMALRASEAVHFIAPLLLNSLPRTLGLMSLGIAAWRGGALRNSPAQRKWLYALLVVGGGLGALTTTLQVWSKEADQPPPAALDWLYPYSVILLAFGYGAGLWLWLYSPTNDRVRWLPRLLAATGQMALSNYLAQSVIFSVLFYNSGFGLFGRMGSAAAALLGMSVFAAQLVFSDWWLGRFRFGPAEWLWRSLTYGRRQPFRRTEDFDRLAA
jgi:uncharacterized protein